MAHNPEVEGSNPSPATKARGPFSNREMVFCIWFVNRFVHGGLLAPRLRAAYDHPPGHGSRHKQWTGFRRGAESRRLR